MRFFEIQGKKRIFESVDLQPFDITTTKLPDYEEMLELPEYFEKEKGYIFDIVWMKPLEYIKKCARGFDLSVIRLKTAREDAKIKKYADLMKKGEIFPMPSMEYSKDGSLVKQEGLHRAFAAIEAGVEKMPVMVVRNVKY